jgi:hypothetical protein
MRDIVPTCRLLFIVSKGIGSIAPSFPAADGNISNLGIEP